MMAAKPVYFSTQIMESMVTARTPLPGEINDITNAIIDGIDGLILSPETAIGAFYKQATEILHQTCQEAESHIDY